MLRDGRYKSWISGWSLGGKNWIHVFIFILITMCQMVLCQDLNSGSVVGSDRLELKR